MKNPFTLSFGRKPLQHISRITQTNEIIENFKALESPNQIYMITGVRGSGKTVMMSNIAELLRSEEEWIVVELNPERDLLQSLAAKLYSLPELYSLFVKAKLDFSAFGIGVSLENVAPITDIENALELMLAQIKMTGKRLLVTIDEVTNSEYIRVFSSAFQIFLRQNAPIYLLMTGLYENIYELQNEKTLTFLYRAPKIMLEPLNYTAVRNAYMNIFKINSEKAGEMTVLTKGYPFAFQVLGYLYWNEQTTKSIEDILPEYDQYLDEYVYSKIWAELSEQDKKVLIEMALLEETKIKSLREKLEMNSGTFSVYRERLKRKGVVDTSQYGKITFSLPRFEEFVKLRVMQDF